MKFKIEENAFDTGVIAPRVGNLLLENYKFLKKDDEKEIVDFAKRNNYNLILLNSNEPIDLSSFLHVGTIYEVEASINDVWKNLENIPVLFKTKELSGADWTQVEELLDIYPPNRYSKDPKLTKEKVLTHKSLILKHLAKNFPKYSLGLFSKESELVGFHFSRAVDSDLLFLQELLVSPKYRVGFASLQLVKDNLKIIMENTSIKSLATRFYNDNSASMSFFTKLGFKKLRKKEYCYHLWL